jgi:hypothetical protein
MFIGEGLRIDGPSIHVKELVASRLRRGDEDVLKPSRAFYYRTSAMLRDGKGLEDVHIHMLIGSLGEIEVKEKIRIHAYGRGVRKVAEEALCEAMFKPDHRVKPDLLNASLQGPTVSGPLTFEGAAFYKLAWGVELSQDLPVGKELGIEVNYATDHGAMKHVVSDDGDSTDSYDYTVRYVPTKKLTVDIMVRPHTGLILVAPTVTATASENIEINWEEARRVKPVKIVDETTGSVGFRYVAEYPLLNTKFSFGWSLRRAAIALPPPQSTVP